MRRREHVRGRAGRRPERAGRDLERRCPHDDTHAAGLSAPEWCAYGANAVLTEFLDRTSEPNGDSWLVLTSIVEDLQYLHDFRARQKKFRWSHAPDGFRNAAAIVGTVSIDSTDS